MSLDRAVERDLRHERLRGGVDGLRRVGRRVGGRVGRRVGRRLRGRGGVGVGQGFRARQRLVDVADGARIDTRIDTRIDSRFGCRHDSRFGCRCRCRLDRTRCRLRAAGGDITERAPPGPLLLQPFECCRSSDARVVAATLGLRQDAADPGHRSVGAEADVHRDRRATAVEQPPRRHRRTPLIGKDLELVLRDVVAERPEQLGGRRFGLGFRRYTDRWFGLRARGNGRRDRPVRGHRGVDGRVECRPRRNRRSCCQQPGRGCTTSRAASSSRP